MTDLENNKIIFTLLHIFEMSSKSALIMLSYIKQTNT